MNSSSLASRFREVFLNGKWIANTNVQEQLLDLSLVEAQKETSGLNTIAKLTFHLNYYVAGVLNVFEGGELEIRDRFSFDLSQMQSEADWEALKTTLFTNANRFADYVEQMSSEKLDTVFVEEKYGDYRRNVEGMIEHGYYHLGQIVLLKKLLEKSWKPDHVA